MRSLHILHLHAGARAHPLTYAKITLAASLLRQLDTLFVPIFSFNATVLHAYQTEAAILEVYERRGTQCARPQE